MMILPDVMIKDNRNRLVSWLALSAMISIAALLVLGATHTAALDICDLNHQSPNTIWGWLLGLAVLGGVTFSARLLQVKWIFALPVAIVFALGWAFVILPKGVCV